MEFPLLGHENQPEVRRRRQSLEFAEEHRFKPPPSKRSVTPSARGEYGTLRAGSERIAADRGSREDGAAAGGGGGASRSATDVLGEAARKHAAGSTKTKSLVGHQVTRFVVPSSVATGKKVPSGMGAEEDAEAAVMAAEAAARASETIKGVTSVTKLADDLMGSSSLTALEQIVQLMNDSIGDAEAQLRGITALGYVAARGSDLRMHRGGQAHQIHYDFDIMGPELLNLQHAGAIGAVLRAITIHTANRRLVLRACWTLEHMVDATENKCVSPLDSAATVASTRCACTRAFTPLSVSPFRCPECRRQFELLGGHAMLHTLEALYGRDPEIRKSLEKLSAPAPRGTTYNSMQCCCVLM